MTLWYGIFISIKPENLLADNTIDQALEKDVKTNVKGYNVCLALKMVKHKAYSNLQILTILTYQ